MNTTSPTSLARFIARLAAVIVSWIATGACALTLLGTVGDAEDGSSLVEIDPATGAVTRTIGAIGYTINGMTFDPAKGILYATTAFESPILGNALVTLDMITAAPSQIGAGAGRYVNLPALSPSGTLFAWSQGPATPNRLVTVDKSTGIATIVGNPQILTFTHSLAFGNDGQLRLLNGDGNLYTIDPATAASTLQGHVDGLPNGYAHHGAIHPVNGRLYALTSKDKAPSPQIVTIDLATRTIVGVVPVNPEVHTLAWVTLPSTLTVTRNGSGSGTVSSSDTFVACGATCSHAYPGGAQVTLAAAAAAGSVFTGWLGACTGAGPCSLSMTADTTVTATFATPSTLADHPLDIDANGSRDALSDGLILIRRLFGLVGTAMTTGALGTGAQRSDPNAIASYIVDVNPKFDVDGNGTTDALTDGLLIVRYLFGLRGTSLVANAIGPGATRTTAVAIESYLQSIVQ